MKATFSDKISERTHMVTMQKPSHSSRMGKNIKEQKNTKINVKEQKKVLQLQYAVLLGEENLYN